MMRNRFRRLMTLGLLLGLPGLAVGSLEGVRLPPGFKIEVYADGLDNARSLVRGERGTLFVSTRGEGKVYALVDADGDGRAERRHTLAEGLNMPNGLAFRDGALYVAEIHRIWKWEGIESRLEQPPAPVMVRSDLPDKTHHGWRYIAFGPDGKLYLALGAPCNVCEATVFERDGRRLETASITRMDADGRNWELVARGVRNSVGFDWDEQGRLWFSDNGRDWLGDDSPSCELNRVDTLNAHYGFPYCHAGSVSDPEFGKKGACKDFVAPQVALGPHVAPLGVEVYRGSQFPAEYRGDLLVAEHGSWNRSRKIGYRLKRVDIEDGRVQGQSVFAEGWLQGESVSGRPVDLLTLPDGSLLVSDDSADRLYRISYAGS